jgi:antitoxin (DNA-binding transcriptional repressor) of toxin-antitoxin stability system
LQIDNIAKFPIIIGIGGVVMRVNTTDLQNAFGKYLSLVQKEDIIIVKNGKSIAKMIKHSERVRGGQALSVSFSVLGRNEGGVVETWGDD